MNDSTPPSPKKHPFSRLYAQVPDDWEPDIAYRLNHDLLINAVEGVMFHDDLFPSIIQAYGDYSQAGPMVFGSAAMLAYTADERGLILNPESTLAPMRGIGAKRARLVIRLLEVEGVIARTDAA